MRVGIRCVHAYMGSGVGIQCARAEDQCRACIACVGTWCMHGDPACMGTRCVHRQRISAVHVSRVWGPGACTHGDPAYVRGPGPCMHGGDSMHVCMCAGIQYGCGDPAGMGRGSMPRTKRHGSPREPMCNAFAMKKVISEKKRQYVVITYFKPCKGKGWCGWCGRRCWGEMGRG